MPRNVVKALRPKGRQWVWALSAAALVGNALRYRQRLEALPVIASTPDAAGAADGDLGRYRLVAVDGVTFEPGALAAAVAHADRHGLDVLDLLPADLDGDRALEYIRMVNPATFKDERPRRRPQRLPGGADRRRHPRQARRQAARRAGRGGRHRRADGRRQVLRAHHQRPRPRARAARRPRGPAAPPRPAHHRQRRRERLGRHALRPRGARRRAGRRARLGCPGPRSPTASSRPWRVGETAAQVDAHARPTRCPGRCATRSKALKAASTKQKTRREQELAAALDQSRSEYRRLLAAGTSRFFLPPREACPWCGSDRPRDPGRHRRLRPAQARPLPRRPVRRLRAPLLQPGAVARGLRVLLQGLLQRPVRARAHQEVPGRRPAVPRPGRHRPAQLRPGRAQPVARRRHRPRPLPAARPRRLPRDPLRGPRHGRGRAHRRAAGLGVEGPLRAAGRDVRRAGRPVRRGQHAPLPRAHVRPS